MRYLALLFLIVFSPALASAETRQALNPYPKTPKPACQPFPAVPQVFIGIKTINVMVQTGFGPDTAEILKVIAPQNRRTVGLKDVATEALQKVFREAGERHPILSTSDLKIKAAGPDINEVSTPSDLVMTFIFSTHADVLNGKRINMASIGLQYSKRGLGWRTEETNWPFIVPDTREEFIKKVQDGIAFLTYHLPVESYCVNDPKHWCPERDPTYGWPRPKPGKVEY